MATQNQRDSAALLAAAAVGGSDVELQTPGPAQTGAREFGAQRNVKWATAIVIFGLLAGLVLTAVLSRPGAPPRVRGPSAHRDSEVARLNEDASDDWDDDSWEDEDWDEGDDVESARKSEPKREPKSQVRGKPKSSASPKKGSDEHHRSSALDDDGFDDGFGDDDFDDDDFDDDDFGGDDFGDEDNELGSADEDGEQDREEEEDDDFADDEDQEEEDDDFADDEDGSADEEDDDEDDVVEAETQEADGCADSGHDCSKSRCCSQPGEQCFKKNSTWAICRSGCLKGRHLTEEEGQPWSCETLGDRTPGKPQKCSALGENCIESHCCSDIGMQCYQKNSKLASCKPSCDKAMDLTDKDSEPWTCKELGTRRPGVAAWVHDECAKDWDDCSKSKCCKRTGVTCFARDDFWAACQEECTNEDWTCKKLGPPTPPTEAVALEKALPKMKPAPWVAQKCSAMGTNCMETKCCRDAGARCFNKDDKYASCKFTCEKGPDPADKDSKSWECGALGPRTPGMPATHVLEGGSKSDWVDDECADTGVDCSASKCCKEEGFQCLKDGDKATCRIGCHDCEPLGARTSKTWEKLSLFCFVVVTKDSYEVDIMREQLRRRAGIFACEGHAMLGEGEGYTVDDELGGQVIGFEAAEVGVSRDGTAGNAELFIHVWDAVKLLDDWKVHDWTIKTDPDAVILPDRLRKTLSKVAEDSHMGDELFAYVKTCHKDNGMKNMMFGSLEAFSRVAVQKYFENEAKCKQLEWQPWGEDLYMNKCMDNIGAIGMDSFTFVSDDTCNGVDCGDSAAAVFHPMKNVSSWKQCFETAIR